MRPLLAAAGLTALVGLAGCAQLSGTQPPLSPEAQPVAEVDCRTEGDWWDPAPETRAPAPTPGRVPAGFDAVAALRCQVDFAPAPVNGAADGPTVRIERFEGDLGPVIDALAKPDDPVPANVACTADMELVPALWLEDSAGAVVPVHYPRDACGKTKPGVREAVERLDRVSVSDASFSG
ncbi:hypothetical protein [Agromyces silvae]|uniref:hypothetical protein n=1 Tax=Agromyces silvae TaxID=3388266 RepID=UPI00280BEEBC|nr:hypothetical protein [Agromyces protaetiae]